MVQLGTFQEWGHQQPLQRVLQYLGGAVAQFQKLPVALAATCAMSCGDVHMIPSACSSALKPAFPDRLMWAKLTFLVGVYIVARSCNFMEKVGRPMPLNPPERLSPL